MYLGIDLGTSGVKAVLLDETGRLLGTQTVELPISRPQPLWSEQNPQDWWNATCDAVTGLNKQLSLKDVKAIGMTGQMHGATFIDQAGDVLRPAILWNDGRCALECSELEEMVPESRAITGNIMMPGFTAPKALWLKKHEPDTFTKVDKVLLPKDYLRFKMTGDFATDMSDAAGTLWLDVGQRDWNEQLLDACGLTREHMPQLFEGNQITGHLSADLAEKWGMNAVPVIAGGGDNAAGAVGVGIVKPNQAMLSLGTSGVYFAVSDGFLSNPESAVHSFCHALPNTWHMMSVVLSAASCLDWVAKLTGQEDVPSMLKMVEDKADRNSAVTFLPYLSGERTPHNDPMAKGVFFGMTHNTGPAELCLAVLEGVGFAFADGMDVLHATSLVPEEISLIGGGARSEYWRQMLSNIFGRKLVYRSGGDVGPALGAARLANLAMNPDTAIEDICPVPELVQEHQPDMEEHARYEDKRGQFQQLYRDLKNSF